jgi:ABC-type multidrug transport system ATPase subunit
MNWVTEFCNRAILLEEGRIVAEGEPAAVVRLHQEHSEAIRAKKAAETADLLGTTLGAAMGVGIASLPAGLRSPGRNPKR